MTEREKIIKIIAPIVSAHGKDEAIADALIKAGIGDVSWWERKCKLCEEDWFLQKKQIEHYAESYKEMLQEDLDKYKHRAEVAERALLNLAYKIVIYIGTYTSDFSSIAVGNAKNYIELEIAAENVKNVELKQAQKELAEERKDG